MKLKIFIFAAIGLLLSSVIYVGASTIEKDNTFLNTTRPNIRLLTQNSLTDEDHQLILAKRVELTLTYLVDYDSLTLDEKEQALASYNDELHAFISSITGETVTYRMEERMLSRLSVEDRDLVISKRVELTLKYFSAYDTMTDTEKEDALIQYQTEHQEFMQSLRSTRTSNCESSGKQM